MTHAPDIIFAQNRAAEYNRTRQPEAPSVDGEYMGRKYGVSHAGTSWACPSLKLFGYSSERAVRGAIKRKLSK